MNKLANESSFNDFAATFPQAAERSIRVEIDTGGIAAGAKKVMDFFDGQIKRLGLPVELGMTGSLGLSYLDPVVEVRVPGMPVTLYGNVDNDSANLILTQHISEKSFVDDHFVLARGDSSETKAADIPAIFIKDTTDEGDEKTEFFVKQFKDKLKRQGLDGIQVVRALDLGVYNQGLVVYVMSLGVVYTNVLQPDVSKIISQSIKKKELVKKLDTRGADKQVRIVTRNCGLIDPESIEAYIQAGGYRAFMDVIGSSPKVALDRIQKSGLRGRGGAGFPTWLKWKLTSEVENDQKYVICNADEGDPGAFMDRSVLESDPHAVLEGLMVAAFCVGATQGYFYIRAEYPLAIERVKKAIAQAEVLGLLGDHILGSDFSFNVKVRLGAGAFVCGEETALIASIEGKRGSPTPRPPFPSVSGLWGKPTCINNVETLASVSGILLKGEDFYASLGTEKSKGTKVFAVTGKVKNAQLVEVPMGTSLQDIVFDICGGILNDKEIKAVQTGGPSGGVIPYKYLSTPVSYESLAELGSIMGSGGMLAMDEDDCMVDVAKFYLKFCVDESCGKCAPCRIGGFQMLNILDRISRGKGQTSDLNQLKRICVAMQKASLCGLGQTAPNPVLSTMKYFKDEYDAYIEGGGSYARKMKKKLANK